MSTQSPTDHLGAGNYMRIRQGPFVAEITRPNLTHPKAENYLVVIAREESIERREEIKSFTESDLESAARRAEDMVAHLAKKAKSKSK